MVSVSSPDIEVQDGTVIMSIGVEGPSQDTVSVDFVVNGTQFDEIVATDTNGLDGSDTPTEFFATVDLPVTTDGTIVVDAELVVNGFTTAVSSSDSIQLPSSNGDNGNGTDPGNGDNGNGEPPTNGNGERINPVTLLAIGGVGVAGVWWFTRND